MGPLDDIRDATLDRIEEDANRAAPMDRQTVRWLIQSLRRMHAERDRLIRDAARLDWVEPKRVVIMRCLTRQDEWKVETMQGLFIRDTVRAAIDAAMERS